MIAIIETYSTAEGLKIFNCLEAELRNITSAEVRKNDNEQSELVLTGECGEEITFRYPFTAGYGGEGPRGTYRVLTQLGFDVSLDFITQNKTFKIHR